MPTMKGRVIYTFMGSPHLAFTDYMLSISSYKTPAQIILVFLLLASITYYQNPHSPTKMSVQYDEIGDNYTLLKQKPSSTLDTATLLTHLGNVDQLDVLDLACGTGYFAQKAVHQGARRVVGVDISPVMIDEARNHSKEDSRLEFYVGDCSKPLGVGTFDVILANWFLNYASNAEEQLTMWKNIHAHLKPGGRCIGITPNLELLKGPFPKGYRFGVALDVVGEVEDGVKYMVSVDNPPFQFENYMLRKDVYEACARGAGLGQIEWLSAVDPKIPGLDFELLSRNMVSMYFQVWRPLEGEA